MSNYFDRENVNQNTFFKFSHNFLEILSVFKTLTNTPEEH
jgi:hypothetical protein